MHPPVIIDGIVAKANTGNNPLVMNIRTLNINF